jgi:hypothetical protein
MATEQKKVRGLTRIKNWLFGENKKVVFPPRTLHEIKRYGARHVRYFSSGTGFEHCPQCHGDLHHTRWHGGSNAHEGNSAFICVPCDIVYLER